MHVLLCVDGCSVGGDSGVISGLHPRDPASTHGVLTVGRNKLARPPQTTDNTRDNTRDNQGEDDELLAAPRAAAVPDPGGAGRALHQPQAGVLAGPVRHPATAICGKVPEERIIFYIG